MKLTNKGANLVNDPINNFKVYKKDLIKYDFSIAIDNWWNSKIIHRKKWEDLKTNRCEICDSIIVVKPVCSNLEKLAKLSKYGKGYMNLCPLCCYHSSMYVRRGRGMGLQQLFSEHYFKSVLNKRFGYKSITQKLEALSTTVYKKQRFDREDIVGY